jgi:hypothetical protein
VFHNNIIRGQNGQEGSLDHQLVYMSPEDYVDIPETDENFPNEVESSHGSNLRDQIAMQMWAAYNS